MKCKSGKNVDVYRCDRRTPARFFRQRKLVHTKNKRKGCVGGWAAFVSLKIYFTPFEIGENLGVPAFDIFCLYIYLMLLLLLLLLLLLRLERQRSTRG